MALNKTPNFNLKCENFQQENNVFYLFNVHYIEVLSISLEEAINR